MAEMGERGDDLASPDAPGEEHDVHFCGAYLRTTRKLTLQRSACAWRSKRMSLDSWARFARGLRFVRSFERRALFVLD
eukprot:7526018-Pyramimonas_sp.AAC.1